MYNYKITLPFLIKEFDLDKLYKEDLSNFIYDPYNGYRPYINLIISSIEKERDNALAQVKSNDVNTYRRAYNKFETYYVKELKQANQHFDKLRKDIIDYFNLKNTKPIPPIIKCYKKGHPQTSKDLEIPKQFIKGYEYYDGWGCRNYKKESDCMCHYCISIYNEKSFWKRQLLKIQRMIGYEY